MGFQQKEVDYSHTFSLVTRTSTILPLLSVSTDENMKSVKENTELVQVDVSTASHCNNLNTMLMCA